MIVDANVVLRAIFPDEAQSQAQLLIRDHITGRVPLKAPALLPYELSNAIWQAEKRGRISRSLANEILQTIARLELEIVTQAWGEMLPMARQFGCSAYDAAYLSLAQTTGEPLMTGDRRLYSAVHDRLDWVLWIEESTTNCG